MPVTLGARPQAGFDQPLELMKDCHRRIESFLDMLLRVAEAPGPLDDAHRRALETALRYFRDAAPNHTRDEEHSLFPRLRQSDSPEVHAALARVHALEADHVRATTLHEFVDLAGNQWLKSGQLPAPALATLRHQLHELRELYRQHIEVEDTQIFPLAAKTLSAPALAAIAQEMRSRRTQPPPCST